jgi:hypothetical protein
VQRRRYFAASPSSRLSYSAVEACSPAEPGASSLDCVWTTREARKLKAPSERKTKSEWSAASSGARNEREVRSCHSSNGSGSLSTMPFRRHCPVHGRSSSHAARHSKSDTWPIDD